jgi:formate/nitrite transporter FocA (FNT family)
VSAPDPAAIWEDGVKEGRRRLRRGTLGLAATGLVGGVDVMLGILLLVVVSGGLTGPLGAPAAHVVGAVGFGLAFVFIAIGRSELFTENFLLPVAAVAARKGTVRSIGRLWSVTLVANLAGMLLFAVLIGTHGVLEASALKAAGTVADTFAQRHLLPALLSAIVAGTVMTLFTWLAAAARSDITRLWLGLLVGWLLAAPSLNHAMVGSGEMMLGLIAGTAAHTTWGDLAQNLPVAVLGNLVGGLAFVTVARLLQAQGEDPDRRGGRTQDAEGAADYPAPLPAGRVR